MSDATEHIAPVSYLPWATPDDDHRAPGRSRGDGTGTGDGARLDAMHEPGSEEESGSSGSAGSSRRQRSDRGPAPRSKDARSFGRGARTAANTSFAGRQAQGVDVDDDEVDVETGPERDDRIDRLIVSRLRRSALSVAEVRSVLVEHGLDQVEVEEWIERYERFGYLDDARLAEQLVHVSAGRRGKGSGAVLQELTRRGVDAEAARAAIEGLDPETELENARTVAERRARQLQGLERPVAERRLSAFLQRRGYSGEVIREVVAEALAPRGS
ncbi:regulatory protein RecX [Agromyces salentinus]|uniref:Regulatory protein RecX n=1 Tax=Agromyces salentinus TaxID=269421 RepID=A0ABN2MZR1_9MICO|nr:regulatory protein RecX [Agromyces salentinus]